MCVCVCVTEKSILSFLSLISSLLLLLLSFFRYVLGKQSRIRVIDVKRETKEHIDVTGLPEGFVALAIQASPIANPYEQRLAICGLHEGVSTLFVTTVKRSKGHKCPARKISQQATSCNVLKFSWHPRSAKHIVALLENPLTHESFLHVYNIDEGKFQLSKIFEFACPCPASPKRKFFRVGKEGDVALSSAN